MAGDTSLLIVDVGDAVELEVNASLDAGTASFEGAICALAVGWLRRIVLDTTPLNASRIAQKPLTK